MRGSKGMRFHLASCSTVNATPALLHRSIQFNSAKLYAEAILHVPGGARRGRVVLIGFPPLGPLIGVAR